MTITRNILNYLGYAYEVRLENMHPLTVRWSKGMAYAMGVRSMLSNDLVKTVEKDGVPYLELTAKGLAAGKVGSEMRAVSLHERDYTAWIKKAQEAVAKA